VNELVAKLRALSPSRARSSAASNAGALPTVKKIRLENLSYRLPNGTWLFRNVDASIAPKSPLVLRGKSGSGKSTLASLVSGANDPTEGKVTYVLDNGEEVPACVDYFNYLSQDPAVVVGTMRENLLLGADEDIHEEALASAMRRVDLWDEFEPKGGLDASVQEGGRNLSGGQVRRLGLARLLARKRSLWIFDEATAALDPHSGAIVEKLIAEIAEEAATLVISHDPNFHLSGSELVLKTDESGGAAGGVLVPS
jgi:ABC-type transport system involved in cytochrome bd biosynthesis fused ATPase/permease subunit